MSKGEKWVIEGFHLYWDSFGQSHFANGELTCHMHTAIGQIEKVQYADPKMAGLIKEGPAIFGSAYCTFMKCTC